MALDAMDQLILEILQEEGRITNVELAQRIGLTPGPTLSRVHKLEEAGYIERFTAIVNRAKLGLPVTAFVSVIHKTHNKEVAQEFLKVVCAFPEVVEVHHIAGEEDYLLKVIAASPADYERFLLNKLTAIECVMRVKTTFVLSTAKSTTRVSVSRSEVSE